MSDIAYGTRLLLLLTTHEIITSDQASQATDANPELPELYLLEQGWVEKSQLRQVAARSFSAESAEGEVAYLDDVLSHELQQKHRLFPVELTEEELIVASASPGTTSCTNELKTASGKPVRYLIIDRITLKEHLDSLAKPMEPIVMNDALETTMAVTTPELQAANLLIGGRFRRSQKLVEGRFSTLYSGKDEQTGLSVSIRHLESYSHLNTALAGPSDEARKQTLRELSLIHI